MFTEIPPIESEIDLLVRRVIGRDRMTEKERDRLDDLIVAAIKTPEDSTKVGKALQALRVNSGLLRTDVCDLLLQDISEYDLAMQERGVKPWTKVLVRRLLEVYR